MRPTVRPHSSQPVSAIAADALTANRAVGTVELAVRYVEGINRRHLVREAGSLRVRFPSPETTALSAVLINTAGGVAGGDRFSVNLAAEQGSEVVVTTAAAEKVYRSHGPAAEVEVRLNVADGGRLAWLPQETILFDRARLARRIEIDLSEDASLLCAEIVVFGRTAMDERLSSASYVDRWRLRRGGKLAFAETVRLEDDVAARLERRAIGGAAIAFATVLIAPGDEQLVARARAAATAFASEFGISAWNGFAIARFCGVDAAHLRADVTALVRTVDGAVLPRLWLS